MWYGDTGDANIDLSEGFRLNSPGCDMGNMGDAEDARRVMSPGFGIGECGDCYPKLRL